MEAEGDVIREERWDRGTLDLRRDETTREDVIQCAAVRVCGASNIPASQLIPLNVPEKTTPITIDGARNIPQGRMPGIKITHVDHATGRGSRKGVWTQPTRRRVHVTQTYYSTAYSNLKQLIRGVIVRRGWEEAMWEGRMNVSDEAVSHMMDIGHITTECWCLLLVQRKPDKCLLYENDV